VVEIIFTKPRLSLSTSRPVATVGAGSFSRPLRDSPKRRIFHRFADFLGVAKYTAAIYQDAANADQEPQQVTI
jgi:hypothetical protein